MLRTVATPRVRPSRTRAARPSGASSASRSIRNARASGPNARGPPTRSVCAPALQCGGCLATVHGTAVAPTLPDALKGSAKASAPTWRVPFMRHFCAERSTSSRPLQSNARAIDAPRREGSTQRDASIGTPGYDTCRHTRRVATQGSLALRRTRAIVNRDTGSWFTFSRHRSHEAQRDHVPTRAGYHRR